ncbi:MAG: ABC transporter permease [Gammaproteobacteria bacterium]|jgi:putative ABC transport system permease protein|tara:strand:- start:513 stop:1697 length:1185 start_codon:yes stop_codon:yes gene_type:complete
MSFIRQVLSVTNMNLRSILERSGSSLVIIVGIAGSVAVMVSLLAMAEGLSSTISSTGEEDRVIILRDGSNSELSSGVAMTEIDTVSSSPGIKSMDGEPMIAGELFAIIDLKKKGAESTSNLPIRGVQPASFKIRPEVEIIEGRNFTTGTAEIIVGKGANNQYEGLELGDQIKVRDSFATVVGIFSSNGNVHESEIWADLAAAQGIFRRGASASSMILKLDSPDSFDEVGLFVESYPNLELKVQSESDFYENQSSGADLIKIFGQVVGYIMAIGAVFAALNTMYSAVSTRLVEIGTLRALGFKGTTVLLALMIEALLLAMIGGLLGAAIAYILFNGYTVSTLAGGSFSQTAFAFAVTADVVQQGLTLALFVGLIGGLFPAWNAARRDITEALRSI